MPMIDVHFDLAPERFAMEVHRRAAVSAHAHHSARFDELLDAALAIEHFAIGASEVAERSTSS